MDKVDLRKIIDNPENFFSHYILSAPQAKLMELTGQDKFDLENVEITIIADGTTISFDKFEKFLKYCSDSYAQQVRSMITNIDELIEEKAKELVETKMSGFFDKICNLQNALDSVGFSVNDLLGWEGYPVEKEELKE